MPCEQINSFAATALSEFKYHNPDGDLVTIEINSETPLDSSNEIHRKLIRHLYRRIGYGASLDDIEYADNKTIDELVDTLIVSAANIPFPTEFDWTERGVGIKGYYCTTINNVVIEQSVGTSCGVTPNVIQGDGTCSETFVPVALNGNQQPIDTNIKVDSVIPPTINGLISNYWINESISGLANSIRAKLMLFWHGHFSADEKIYQDPDAVLRYYKVLFKYAFTDFKEFVKAIGRTPLMLKYLNGHESHGDPLGVSNPYPNENYARELLELFTMGTEYYANQNIVNNPDNPDDKSNYTPEQINDLARALTGWRVQRYYGTSSNDIPPKEDEYLLHYNRHDWSEKTILGVNYPTVGWFKIFPNSELSIPTESGTSYQPYYPTNITGKPYEKNANGIYVGDDNLPLSYDASDDEKTERMIITAASDEYNYIHDEIIFKQRADQIAYFICKKLYKFYVYAGVDDEHFTLTSSLDIYLEKLANVFKYGIDNVDSTTLEPLGTIDPTKPKWVIHDVLRVLFKSQHFYDPGLFGTQIKSPVGCAASFFRAGNLQGGMGNDGGHHYRYRTGFLNPNFSQGDIEPYMIMSPDHLNFYSTESDEFGNPIPSYNLITGEGIAARTVVNYMSGYKQSTTSMIEKLCDKIGQNLLSPPDVAGWPGHHNWLNEFTLVKRWELFSAYFELGHQYVQDAKEQFRLTVQQLLELEFGMTNTPYKDTEKIVQVFWRHLFAVEPTDRQIQDGIAVYSDGWNEETYGAGPDIRGIYPDTAADTANRIANLLEYMTRQPSFQLV